MRVPFSYLDRLFDSDEADLIWSKVKPVVMSGDFTLGKALKEFENAYAQKVDVAHAIGVGSGTAALFLAIKGLNLHGEIITTPYSFYATTAAILQAGCQPVFADVRDDFNIDPAAIEAAITPATVALLPVHWGGRPCDMAKIHEIATRHGLAVIEDACQGIGSKWNGKPLGSWGNAGAFSLHPLKRVLCWGDGGLVTTNDDVLADNIRKLRNHGMTGRETIESFGYNSRLDTTNAVVAHHVLGKLDATISYVQKFAARLNSGLAGINSLQMVPMPVEAFPNWYLFTFLADDRDNLVAALHRASIDCKIHYPLCLHEQKAAAKLGHSSLLPAYRNYRSGDFPRAERCARMTVSLPIHEWLSMDDASYMIQIIRDFYSQRGDTSAAA